MRLRSKFLTILLPVLILPLTGIAFIAQQQLNTLTQNSTNREIVAALKQFRYEFATLIETTIANNQLFSQSNQLKTYLLTENEGERFRLLQPSLMRLFSSYQYAFPDYLEIRLILPDGYIDTRVVSQGLSANHSEYEYKGEMFTSMRSHNETSHVHFEMLQEDQKFILHVGQTILIQDSDADPLTAPYLPRGYLVLTVNLDRYIKRLTSQRIGKDGFMFAIDHDGYIRAHPNPQMLHTQLPQHKLLWQQLQNDGNLELNLFNIPSYVRGFIQSDQLLVIATEPVAEFHAEGDKLTRAVAIIFVTTVIFILLFFFVLFSRLFLQPIEQLRKAMHDFGHGEPITEPNSYPKDEFGELTHDFFRMAGQLDESHQQIQFQAYHDNLTGLANRLYLRTILQKQLREQPLQPFAIILLDIDGFKKVNDIMGHRAGDDLLKLIAKRLLHAGEALTETNDLIFARLGGDEFLIVMHNTCDAAIISAMAQSILEKFIAPFVVQKQNVYVGASIGVAIFPEHGSTAEEIMHNADLAMFSAKHSGKNRIVYYENSMHDFTRERAIIEVQLRAAMESGHELFMVYQPKLDLHTGKITSLESLIRWNQPKQGMIRPDIFIPAAEDSGLIVTLGEWILRTVCRQISQWQDSIAEEIKVAVNISAQQLIQTNFLDRIGLILAQEQCPPHLLEFELTETSMLSHDVQLSEIMNKISSLGITISLDDFGTGYSSLSHLRHFSINTIKIDRSFIEDADKNEDDQAIVNAIISMSHNLGMSVVAEGVETLEQLQLLQQRQCDFIQGYYISRPMVAEDLIRFLEDFSIPEELQIPLPQNQSYIHNHSFRKIV